MGARPAADQTWTPGQAAHRFRCKFAEFGTSFWTHEPCCLDRDALQLTNNNILLTTILAKFGIAGRGYSRINGGKVSAEEFTAAMAEYAEPISKFSNYRFKQDD